ncbi:GTPase IMAP family member 4 [Labeo rohita]|uniref:GTPase IMAP family member 4 n=1 Tax=Labeo rohita TaxID=84645 RepID=A0ABQ8MPA4_LABRO|nr:GTPase IMAP family member 4 [Labeo rohita]KAI2664530.1 GTPase IMAP family member 4 [Labeo rohita]
MDDTTNSELQRPITDVNFTEEQRPTFSGNKYFILNTTPGMTAKPKEDISRKVLKRVSGQQVFNVEECDAILVFCFIVSRAGTDTDAALHELNTLSESKPAVFMVFHHTFDLEKVLPDNSRYVTRLNTLTVDCLFNEDEGLLKCVKNYEALTRIHQWLQPQVKVEQTQVSWLKLLLSCFPCSHWCTQRDTETTKVSSYLEVESELVLVLLGVSGPEKTTVERMILGREESQADSSPATQMKITVDTGEVDGEQVTVINTPDWFSSELSTEEIQRKIQMCIRLSSHGPHAFFLVIPAKQFSEEEKQIVKKMEMIFEERCQERVMILYTVTDEQQRQNIQDHDLQAFVKKCGNQFHVLNISETGNKSQVSELLKTVEQIVAGKGESSDDRELNQTQIETAIAKSKQVHRGKHKRYFKIQLQNPCRKIWIWRENYEALN